VQLRHVQANGIQFAYLEGGSGPTVFLLHGYPDSAYSWSHQFEVLIAAGYRVIAPFTRGYPPTEVPAKGYFDRATLATDVKALVEKLCGGERIDLVGQDWGAGISYGVLGAYPEIVKRAVLLAVPHPVTVRQTLRRSPKHVVRSFHWFLFQLPWLPELLLRARNGAFLETLWKLWSPGEIDRAYVADIRTMMMKPGVIEATLGYYRALLRKSRQDPALIDVTERLDAPIHVPTRVLCGGRDMRRELLEKQRVHFVGPYEWHVVEGAGHFLHREKPEEVNRWILDWLQRPEEGASTAREEERAQSQSRRSK
jgi:pimeloyl-ACP methyl ester carboxylesterase